MSENSYGRRVYECLVAISTGTESYRFVTSDKGHIFATTKQGSMEPMDYAMKLFADYYKEYCIDRDVSVLGLLDDSVHKCPSCSSNKVLVSEMQTRSSDEGATVIRICAQCLERF